MIAFTGFMAYILGATVFGFAIGLLILYFYIDTVKSRKSH